MRQSNPHDGVGRYRGEEGGVEGDQGPEKKNQVTPGAKNSGEGPGKDFDHLAALGHQSLAVEDGGAQEVKGNRDDGVDGHGPARHPVASPGSSPVPRSYPGRLAATGSDMASVSLSPGTSWDRQTDRTCPPRSARTGQGPRPAPPERAVERSGPSQTFSGDTAWPDHCIAPAVTTVVRLESHHHQHGAALHHTVAAAEQDPQRHQAGDHSPGSNPHLRKEQVEALSHADDDTSHQTGRDQGAEEPTPDHPGGPPAGTRNPVHRAERRVSRGKWRSVQSPPAGPPWRRSSTGSATAPQNPAWLPAWW